MIPDDRDVLRAARKAILEARRITSWYAGVGADSSQISKILVATDTVLVERRFDSEVKGMAFERLGGGHVIAIDSACTHADELYTLRHEIAHVLRGEAGEPTYLTAEDRMSHSERVADLFAIADMAPTAWLKPAIRGRRIVYAVQEVKQILRALTDGWSEPRLLDRAKLRVLLFREYGI